MYYYLLTLITFIMHPLYASQADDGERPLSLSVASPDVLISMQALKRKKDEYESIAYKRMCQSASQEHSEDLLQQIKKGPVPTAAQCVLPPVRLPQVGIRYVHDKETLTLHQIASRLNEISLMYTITELSFLGYDFETVPNCIYSLIELAVLNLGGNRLGANQHYIDLDVTHMKKLRELNLSYNQISALPKKAFAPHSLKILLLAGNLLTEVDPTFLPADLQLLELEHNKLRSIPSLTDKSQLKIVAAAHNNITVFDAKKTLPKYMQFVDVSHNPIEIIEDPQDWKMGGNGQLLLEYAGIQEFPLQLCKIPRLCFLGLVGNKITIMPDIPANSFPHGCEIDLRANEKQSSVSSNRRSENRLMICDTEQVEKKANIARAQHNLITILTGIRADNIRAAVKRSKWPKPEIIY